MSGRCRHEAIWIAYLLTVGAAALLGGADRDALCFVAIQAAVLGGVLLLPRAFAREPARAIARGVFSTVALPVVFSSLALVLPAVHPEPYEFLWIAVDRAVFGTDPTVALQALCTPALVEVLQLCYAVFYLVPIVAVLWAAHRGGRAAYEWGLDVVVLGFTCSYVGYLLWPTLPPYRFLWHERPIEGLLFAGEIHAALDAAEVHKWNCFPSGHTMLSGLSLAIVWRHARAGFWTLVGPVTMLVLATMVLRYHYVVDVVAGLCGVPLTLWLVERVRTPGPA